MHAVVLVVDTNVLGVDPPLAGNAMLRLLDASQQEQLRLVVPELVVREAANAWSDAVAEQLRTVERAERRLADLGVRTAEPTMGPLEALRGDKEAEIRAELNRVGATCVALPPCSHEEIVERALARRQPFDASGKDGYRDTLLWETALELARTDDVIFVSRDVRAFFDGKPEAGMSRLLSAEVEQRCGRPDGLRLFFDLDRALDEAVRRTQEEVARAEQQRIDREAKRDLSRAIRREAFATDLRERLADAVYYADLEWSDMGALLPHRSTHAIEIDDVEEVAEVTVVSARRLSERVVADLSARLLVSVHADLPAAIARTLDEDDALVYGDMDEWGDARATALRAVVGYFEATFDAELTEPVQVRLRRLARSRR